jgi:hypothetical protein
MEAVGRWRYLYLYLDLLGVGAAVQGSHTMNVSGEMTPARSPSHNADIKSRDDVLKMGIGAYNEECRSIVMRCVGGVGAGAGG